MFGDALTPDPTWMSLDSVLIMKNGKIYKAKMSGWHGIVQHDYIIY
jgi:hypothetical protein